MDFLENLNFSRSCRLENIFYSCCRSLHSLSSLCMEKIKEGRKIQTCFRPDWKYSWLVESCIWLSKKKGRVLLGRTDMKYKGALFFVLSWTVAVCHLGLRFITFPFFLKTNLFFSFVTYIFYMSNIWFIIITILWIILHCVTLKHLLDNRLDIPM